MVEEELVGEGKLDQDKREKQGVRGRRQLSRGV